jgi:hypothetical protein
MKVFFCVLTLPLSSHSIMYSLHPHIFVIYSTNRNDPKYLTSSLISALTLSVLTNLPFLLLLILSPLTGTDRAAVRAAAIVEPTDPSPSRGAGGGAAVGRRAVKSRHRHGAREELPSAGADDVIPRQAR